MAADGETGGVQRPANARIGAEHGRNVINPSTEEIHDGLGLKALDALLYGLARDVGKITPEIRNEMIEKFRKKYPCFRYDCFEILTDKDDS